jgi:DNA (cytosine-5)-methyltransferase 1
MNKLRALDLFCCAGGATKGLQQAGFYVVGVDIEPQPNYCGDEFFQADALTFPLDGYDLIWASPPCQGGSELTPVAHRDNYLNLIPDTRERLIASGSPYIIENVEGYKRELRGPLMLCGTMFGLPIWRHRFFECWPSVFTLLPPCKHDFIPVKVSGTGSHLIDGKRNKRATSEAKRQAMGIDWTNRDELSQAIPPAYSEFLGHLFIEQILRGRK